MLEDYGSELLNVLADISAANRDYSRSPNAYGLPIGSAIEAVRPGTILYFPPGRYLLPARAGRPGSASCPLVSISTMGGAVFVDRGKRPRRQPDAPHRREATGAVRLRAPVVSGGKVPAGSHAWDP